MGHAGKMEGMPVSKGEVLSALGHPVSWARDERKGEFNKRLAPGMTDLDIAGIKGIPGAVGYLDYLLRSLRCPLGWDTGLVNREVDEGIKEMVEREIVAEVWKYTQRLAELEEDPVEVERYIAKLRRRLEVLPRFIEDDPDAQLLEELRESGHRKNAEIEENIERIHQEIARYGKLLEGLR